MSLSEAIDHVHRLVVILTYDNEASHQEIVAIKQILELAKRVRDGLPARKPKELTDDR